MTADAICRNATVFHRILIDCRLRTLTNSEVVITFEN